MRQYQGEENQLIHKRSWTLNFGVSCLWRAETRQGRYILPMGQLCLAVSLLPRLCSHSRLFQ